MARYFDNLTCKRNREQLTINWNHTEPGEVSIYYNALPAEDGNEKLLLVTSEGQVTFDDPLPGRRVYFILRKEGHPAEFAGERELPLLGTCNFRDLGGYTSGDGRRVRWGLFYRSGALHKLIDHDARYVASLGIRTVIDYRSAAGSAGEPDDAIEGARIVNISAMPLADEAVGGFGPGTMLKAPERFAQFRDLTEIMRFGYRDMVFGNPAFAEMFRVMLAGEAPFIQHCESGKDRAGMGSALLLLLLGVPIDVVRQDYLASNTYIGICNGKFMDKMAAWLDSEEKIELFSRMMQVSAEYLESALDLILERYPTLEAYFETEYGLTAGDLVSLRDRYLY